MGITACSSKTRLVNFAIIAPGKCPVVTRSIDDRSLLEFSRQLEVTAFVHEQYVALQTIDISHNHKEKGALE